MERYRLLHGDCCALLRTFADSSVDSIVTDPPYGLTSNGGGPSSKGQNTPHGRAQAGASRGGFMGLAWDRDVPSVEVWAECLRVLKPGGYLLAFAGTRTQHRMATRIEDAGFEIRDLIAWVYGSGFPKSHNGEWGGTALKPALEPITMARKPLAGTVAANWTEHGTGALNIDACRVPSESMPPNTGAGGMPRRHDTEARGPGIVAQPHPGGRWPANVIHDGSDDVVACFPQSKGQQGAVSGDEPSSKTNNVYGQFGGRPATEPRGDTGSGARFFYCAKASKRERDEGLDGFEQRRGGAEQFDSRWKEGTGEMRQPTRANIHPTVKPTDLMAYLCRLVTPHGGVVLDPYMGSGSTGKAAIREGFRFTGIEREAEYLAIARARIEFECRRGHQISLPEVA
ncbi:DNA-methyltransferase [Ottowia sp. VDI28]|uniref:DNA-methyltransferase n=1 Tax=Ottowia sp. VDI28 TaxID=3133968 RepID=UPI003C2DAE9D